MKVHCKPCKREWDEPPMLGPPRCICRKYGEEGPLPKEPVNISVQVLPSQQVLGIGIGDNSGVVVHVKSGETVVVVSNEGKETEYKFPH